MAKFGKTRNDTSWGFDALCLQDFDNVPSIGASVGTTTVQAILPFPQRFKIAKVGLGYTAIGTGTYAFNLCVGTGAEVACNTVKDAIAAAGNVTFSSDQLITIGAPGVTQVFLPTQPDTIYDSASNNALSASFLTLRVTTPASGSITNLKVMLLVAVVDPRTNDSGGIPGTNW